MIRINLLGVPRPKRGKRPAMTIGADVSAGSLVLIVALGVAALTIGLNLYFWQSLNRAKEQIATEMSAANRESMRLANVKSRVKKRNGRKPTIAGGWTSSTSCAPSNRVR